MPQWILIPLGVVIFGAVCYRETRRGRFDEAAILRTARFGMAFAILAAAGLVPLTTGRIADNPALFGAAGLTHRDAHTRCCIVRIRHGSLSSRGRDLGYWQSLWALARQSSRLCSSHLALTESSLCCGRRRGGVAECLGGEAALSLSGDRHWCGLWNRTRVLRVFGLLACARKNRLTGAPADRLRRPLSGGIGRTTKAGRVLQ